MALTDEERAQAIEAIKIIRESDLGSNPEVQSRLKEIDGLLNPPAIALPNSSEKQAKIDRITADGMIPEPSTWDKVKAFGGGLKDAGASYAQAAVDAVNPGIAPLGELMGEVTDKYLGPKAASIFPRRQYDYDQGGNLVENSVSDQVHAKSDMPGLTSAAGSATGVALSLPRKTIQLTAEGLNPGIKRAMEVLDRARQPLVAANKPIQETFDMAGKAASNLMPNSPLMSSIAGGAAGGGIVSAFTPRSDLSSESFKQSFLHGAGTGAAFGAVGGIKAKVESKSDPFARTAQIAREAKELRVDDPIKAEFDPSVKEFRNNTTESLKKKYATKLSDAKAEMDARLEQAKGPAQIVAAKKWFEVKKRELADSNKSESYETQDKVASYKQKRKGQIKSKEDESTLLAERELGQVAGEAETQYRGVNEGRLKEAGDAMEEYGARIAKEDPRAAENFDGEILAHELDKRVGYAIKTGKTTTPVMEKVVGEIKSMLFSGGGKDTAPAPMSPVGKNVSQGETPTLIGSKGKDVIGTANTIMTSDGKAIGGKPPQASAEAMESSPLAQGKETNFHDLYAVYQYAKTKRDRGNPGEKYEYGEMMDAIKDAMFKADPTHNQMGGRKGDFQQAFEHFKSTSDDIEVKNRLVYNQGEKSPDAIPTKEVIGARNLAKYSDPSTPENIYKPDRFDPIKKDSNPAYPEILSKIDVAKAGTDAKLKAAKEKSASTLGRVEKVEDRVKRGMLSKQQQRERALSDEENATVGAVEKHVSNRVAKQKAANDEEISSLEDQFKKYIDYKQALENSTIGTGEHVVMNPGLNPKGFFHMRMLMKPKQALYTSALRRAPDVRGTGSALLNPAVTQSLNGRAASSEPGIISRILSGATDFAKDGAEAVWEKVKKELGVLTPEKRAEMVQQISEAIKQDLNKEDDNAEPNKQSN